jgi:hypothetical protein
MRELVNTRDTDGNSVNNEKTFKAKVGAVRTLIRKHLLRSNLPANAAAIANFDLKTLIKSPASEFINLLQVTWPNSSTRTTVLGYLVSIIDNLQHQNFGWSDRDYEIVYQYMLDNAHNRNRARMNNEAPEVIRQNPEIKWETFVEYEKQMRDNDFGSMDHLALAIRVLFAPRRDHDFSLLKFCTRLPVLNEANDKYNYIEVPTDANAAVKLDFRSFKTVRSFNRQVFHLTADSEYSDVAPDLVELAKIIRKNRERFPRTFVFPAVNRDEYSSTRVANQLKDVVSQVTDGVVFGVRILRKVYTTYALRVHGNSAIKREHVAFLMAHSVSMSNTYAYNDEEAGDAIDNAELQAIRDRLSEQERKSSDLGISVNKFRAAIGSAVSILNTALGEGEAADDAAEYTRDTLKVIRDFLNANDSGNALPLVSDLLTLLQ